MHAARAVVVASLLGLAACANGSGPVAVHAGPPPPARPTVTPNPWAIPADAVTTTTTVPPTTTTTEPPATTTTTTRPPRPRSTTTTTVPARDDPPVSATGIEGIIAAAFGRDARAAIRVARCESSLIPTKTNGPVRGLFQVHESHAADWADVVGVSYWSSWDDPTANATFAAWLHARRGWRDWSCQP